jgi:hypothetical protein
LNNFEKKNENNSKKSYLIKLSYKMPAIHESSAEKLKRANSIITTLENSLKIFEEDRIKSFENWQFDDNEKCSVLEVKVL